MAQNSEGMFEEWRQPRAAKRVKSGDGRPLQRFRWWQQLGRALFYLQLSHDNGRQTVGGGTPRKEDPVARKEWRDLSPRQKGGIVAAVVVQIGLLLAALSDIHRWPEGQIRDNKKWPWTLAAFVNFVGPVSYFLFGRKR